MRLRSVNRQQLLVPRCRLDTHDRWVFAIAGPTVWNSLPDELIDPLGVWFILTVLNSSSRESSSVFTNVTSTLEGFLKTICAIYLLSYLLYLLTCSVCPYCLLSLCQILLSILFSSFLFSPSPVFSLYYSYLHLSISY